MRRYGKVRKVKPPMRRLLNGREANNCFHTVEVEDFFEAHGLTFNLHRSQDYPDKWGVTESISGYSVSRKFGDKTEKGFLHSTKESAMQQAKANVAKFITCKEDYYRLIERTKQEDSYAELHVMLPLQLLKIGLWK